MRSSLTELHMGGRVCQTALIQAYTPQAAKPFGYDSVIRPTNHGAPVTGRIRRTPQHCRGLQEIKVWRGHSAQQELPPFIDWPVVGLADKRRHELENASG